MHGTSPNGPVYALYESQRGLGRGKEKGQRAYFKEITAENFPNQGKETFRPRKAREFQWNPKSSIPTLTDLH